MTAAAIGQTQTIYVSGYIDGPAHWIDLPHLWDAGTFLPFNVTARSNLTITVTEKSGPYIASYLIQIGIESGTKQPLYGVSGQFGILRYTVNAGEYRAGLFPALSGLGLPVGNFTLSIVMEPLTGQLFTQDTDYVDFDHLTPTQQDSVAAKADLYNTGNGNDVVYLPSKTSAQNLWAGVPFDYSHTFTFGNGLEQVYLNDQPAKLQLGTGATTIWNVDAGLTFGFAGELGTAILIGQGIGGPLQATVMAMGEGNVIDLADIVANALDFDPTTKLLTIGELGALGVLTPEAQLKVASIPQGDVFYAAPDGHGGTQITLGPPRLFSDGSDTVDFNALTSVQIAAIGKGADLYNALPGNDVITLPDTAHAADLTGTRFAFSLAETFHAGDGADTFNFSKGLAAYDGQVLHLEGGASSGDAGAGSARPFANPAAFDRLELPLSADAYSFSVTFTNRDASPGHTLVGLRDTAGAGKVLIDTQNVEVVSFATAIHNPVALVGGNKFTELAALATEVYGPITDKHFAEPLAYDPASTPASTTDVGDFAVARGWHEVSALELGMLAADFGTAGGLRYSLVNGFYQATDPLLPGGLPDTAEADALVLVGVTGSGDAAKRTLAIAFRGTDQYADFTDYFNFRSQAYAKFAPLIAALKAYVVQADGDQKRIEQVLVTGHSLGGGLAQIFAGELSQVYPASNITVATFGSPGAELPLPSTQQLNVLHTDDLVGIALGGLSRNALARTVITAAIAKLPEVGPVLATVLSAIVPKYLSGPSLLLDSDIDNPLLPISLTEHSMGRDPGLGHSVYQAGYVNDVEKLVRYAGDKQSPVSKMQFAIDLAAGNVASALPKIAIGNGTLLGGNMTTGSGDAIVLGDRDWDDVILWRNYDPASFRTFDGGGSLTGAYRADGSKHDPVGLGDELRINERGWSVRDAGQYFALDDAGGGVAAFLYRIDTVRNPSGFLLAPSGAAARAADTGLTPASFLVHLDGSPTTVQLASAGATTLTVDGSADVAQAGLGVTTIESSLPGMSVIYGPDTTLVHVTGSNSVIASDGRPGAAQVTIDTGDGMVAAYGGPGDEVFIGHLGGASFDGGGGFNTLDYSALTVSVTIDLTDGSATGADGQSDRFANIQRWVAGSVTGNVLRLGSGGASGVLDDIGTDFVNFGSIVIMPGSSWQLTGAAAPTATTLQVGANATLVVDGLVTGAATYILQSGHLSIPVDAASDTGLQFDDPSGPAYLTIRTTAGATEFAGAVSGFSSLDRVILEGMPFAAGDVASYDPIGQTLRVVRSGTPLFTINHFAVAPDAVGALAVGEDAGHDIVLGLAPSFAIGQFDDVNGVGQILVNAGTTLAAGGTSGFAIGGLAIGDQTGAAGGATVTGDGALLTNQGPLTVGGWGYGSLAVQNGGTVITTLDEGQVGPAAEVAARDGSDGSNADVSGVGSSWQVTGALIVGADAYGSLHITAGGAVSADAMTLGVSDDSAGIVSVIGKGSSLDLAGGLTIGMASSAELSILNGASVGAGQVVIGAGASGTGNVDIQGAGSHLDIAGDLDIGLIGVGVLTLGSDTELTIVSNLNIGATGVLNQFGGLIDPEVINNAGRIGGAGGIVATASFVNAGTLFAANGTETLEAPVLTGSGVLEIDTLGTLTLNVGSVAATQTVTFADASGVLSIGTLGGFAATISNFIAGDQIVLQGVTVGGSSFDPVLHVLTLYRDASLDVVGTLQFGSSVTDGSAIAVNGVTPCFMSGTRITTERGEVAVEDLRVGDRVRVVTHQAAQPVVWLGRRTVDCTRHPEPHKVWPVRVAAHAFGRNRPCRDLFLSPDHALYVGDVLIPVKYLTNGGSIAQVRQATVTYHHVELPRHGVLLAEGLPAESYLDTGDRSNFANNSGPVMMCPDFSSRKWEAEGCAPLVVSGSGLHAARQWVNACAVGKRTRDAIAV
ncbi:MAG: Hint domain-containing protein [Acetobacteraceae bacterium]